MAILNIGSINIDHVYEVEHFVRPGETLNGKNYQLFAGGKGFNQSVALARAGADIHHVGRVGTNSEWLLERLQADGVDTTQVQTGETPTGHAIIQVIPSGENAIVLYGGANQSLTEDDIDAALLPCAPGDYLLLQNETNLVGYAMEKARKKGLKLVFNPAPMSSEVLDYPLDLVDLFVLNETEAETLTGTRNPEEACNVMRERFLNSKIVLTMGAKGAIYADGKIRHQEAAHPVEVVDTTAAGDTFIGYFLAEWMQSGDPLVSLTRGCRAAALCVMRPGASDSIPMPDELKVEI
jgi:ribokinase